MTHTDQPKSGYPGFIEPEPARRWHVDWVPASTCRHLSFKESGQWKAHADVLAALNETESLRARVRELEAFRDWVEMKRPHDEEETDCLTCRAALAGGRGETDGGVPAKPDATDWPAFAARMLTEVGPAEAVAEIWQELGAGAEGGERRGG